MSIDDLPKLPDAETGVDGLMAFAEVYGLEATWNMVSWLQNNRDAGAVMARHHLAKAMVEKIEAADPSSATTMITMGGSPRDSDRPVSHGILADDLGYSPTNRTNLFKTIDGTRRRKDVARGDR